MESPFLKNYLEKLGVIKAKAIIHEEVLSSSVYKLTLKNGSFLILKLLF